jgi:hypothetical protein
MTTSAALPTHDHPTAVPAAAIPTQRGAPSETPAPEPAVLPRRRPAAVLGVVAGMAVGAAGTLIAAAIAAAPAVVPAPDDAPRVVPEPRVAFAGTVSVPGRELTSFGDGDWQVGIDVVPGTYATTGGVDCRHALRPAVTGRDIVQTVVHQGPATVVLADGSGFFATSGCGTWTRTA